MSQTDIILDGILDAGEILLKAGAEISRVEDTVHRMSVAYGFVRADVFVITSNIVVTVHTEDGSNITQTRRITGRSTNMRKIEQVNALSRKVCANPIPAGEFREAVADISRMPACSNRVILAAYLIIASAFAVFFRRDNTGWSSSCCMQPGSVWPVLLWRKNPAAAHHSDYCGICSDLSFCVVHCVDRLGIQYQLYHYRKYHAVNSRRSADDSCPGYDYG